MAATVIDQLIITLGIDPKNFDKGQKAAAKKIIETEIQVKKSSDAMAKSLGRVALQFAGLFVAVKSIGGVIDFFKDLNANTRQLGLDSKNFGIAGNELRNWQNAAEMAGGKASDITRTVAGLQKSLFDLQYQGDMSDQLVQLARLGVEFTTVAGKARPFTDVMFDVAKAIERSGMQRPEAFQYLQSAGFDEGSTNLILSGSKALKEYLVQQEKRRQVSEGDIAASTRMAQSWENLKQNVVATAQAFLTAAEPAISKIFELLNKGVEWVGQHQDTIVGWLNKIANWFAGSESAGVKTGIAQMVDSFSTLTNTIETLGRAWDYTFGGLGKGIGVGAAKVVQAMESAKSPSAGNKEQYQSYARIAAKRYGVPADMLERLIQQESGWNPQAKSKAGAVGLMQLMPKYFKGAGRNPYGDIDVGTKHLRGLYDRYKKEGNDDSASWYLAAEAYNAGATRVSNANKGGKPLAAETKAYAPKVTGMQMPASIAAMRAQPTPSVGAMAGTATAKNITNETHIDSITIHTQATDANGVASGMHRAVDRKFTAAQAEQGMN